MLIRLLLLGFVFALADAASAGTFTNCSNDNPVGNSVGNGTRICYANFDPTDAGNQFSVSGSTATVCFNSDIASQVQGTATVMLWRCVGKCDTSVLDNRSTETLDTPLDGTGGSLGQTACVRIGTGQYWIEVRTQKTGVENPILEVQGE